MKTLVMTLVLLSLIGKISMDLLPRGDKSPLHPPLKFLLSLCLIAVLASPFFKREEILKNFSLPETTNASEDAKALILERMGNTMKKSVDTAFPNTEYGLEIYADGNGVPTAIKVIGAKEEGEKIAEFIQKNYGLKTVAE